MSRAETSIVPTSGGGGDDSCPIGAPRDCTHQKDMAAKSAIPAATAPVRRTTGIQNRNISMCLVLNPCSGTGAPSLNLHDTFSSDEWISNIRLRRLQGGKQAWQSRKRQRRRVLRSGRTRQSVPSAPPRREEGGWPQQPRARMVTRRLWWRPSSRALLSKHKLDQTELFWSDRQCLHCDVLSRWLDHAGEEQVRNCLLK
jgi:hypothetical protein